MIKRMTFKKETRPGIGKDNEDYTIIRQLSPESIISVLADGMGGRENGLLAARLSAETICQFISDNFSEGDICSVISNALLLADINVAEASKKSCCKMGCAIAVVVIRGQELYYASLGNVRIYHVDRNTDIFELISVDHVFTGSHGEMFLTKSIRGRGLREDDIQIRRLTITSDTIIRLCSDGWYLEDVFDDASIVEIAL